MLAAAANRQDLRKVGGLDEESVRVGKAPETCLWGRRFAAK